MNNVVGGAAIIGGTFGSACAKTDCKDGYYYKADYLVVGIGLTAGVDISYLRKLDSVGIEVSESFSIDGDYPQAYESYIDV